MSLQSVSEGARAPFRLSLLTEVGEDPRHQAAVARIMDSVCGLVSSTVEVTVFYVGESDQFAAIPCFQPAPTDSAPPGERWNQALRFISNTSPDAVCFLAPDSVIDAQTLLTYVAFMSAHFRCLASFDQYMIDDAGEQVVFWNGYSGKRQGLSVLTGRCLHREWLDKEDWSLWKPEATDLELGMQPALDRLQGRASLAGEHRILGCIAHEMGLLSVRHREQGLFNEEGDAAGARPVDRVEFFQRFYPGVSADVFLDGYSGSQRSPLESSADKTETVWISEGEEAFGQGDLNSAETCFRQALALNPTNSIALNNLGVTYHTQGQLEAAERHYLKAAALGPQSADAFVGLVTLALDAGQTGLALRYTAQGLRRDPTHTELIDRAQQLKVALE